MSKEYPVDSLPLDLNDPHLMPYSLVIFDLDGTLVDSLPWFLRNVNDVADRFGFRRVADGDVEALRHASTRDIEAAHLTGIPKRSADTAI
jgi:phosphoglycolate phosphatase-like HAD superfamily hydrolase